MSNYQAKVSLIDFTGAGSPDPARHAATVLVFTKQTRLTMEPGLLERIAETTDVEIIENLEYMANTIPSSWEFVSYTFLINDVTRAFTHQLVRTRSGSYAQQTMRVLDVDGWTYGSGPTVSGDDDRSETYGMAMSRIGEAYSELIRQGAAIEDARGVLPTNIHTNIVAKFDLRTLAETARKRASSRTQGEYRFVMDLILSEVIRVHPWAELFLSRDFDAAAKRLENKILSMRLEGHEKTAMIKLIDQMRTSA